MCDGDAEPGCNIHAVCFQISCVQMQTRDYPMPYMLGVNVSAEGRLLFAEQEAQDRGT